MTSFKEHEGHISTIGLELHGINSPLIPLHLTNLKAFQPQAEMLSRMMGVPENCVFVSLRAGSEDSKFWLVNPCPLTHWSHVKNRGLCLLTSQI